MGAFEDALLARRGAGGKCLVPYLTGGLGEWTSYLRAAAAAGADAIEVGVPFSDPVMDGPIIQEASERALRAGATPVTILDELSRADIGVPTAVMTYANLVDRAGWQRFASSLAVAGVSAAILPDIPLEETGPWCEAADAAGVETVLLAAPTAPDERLERIVARSRGFVYAVGLLGITGERVTDLPVLVGVGISTPEQAVEVCEVADGVVVGSALVRQVLESGAGPESTEVVAELVGSFRRALDAG
jgi:tryptophan synthase alpha chain